jgi:restriction endonuclease S subunit
MRLKDVEFVRCKDFGEISHGVSYKPTDERDKEDGILILRACNIQDSAIVLDDNVYVDAKCVDRSKRLRKGDILVCGTNGSLRLVGKSAIIPADDCGAFGSFMLRLRVRDGDAQFVQYQLSALVDRYRGLFSTVTINQLTATQLGNMKFWWPDEQTQRAIVAYLDEKVGAIDGRVAVLERKLAAYRRLKASVINRAVTHGSGTRKMKATGIPWLPQVPEEWEVKRMKDIVSSMRSGGTPKATVEDFYSDDGVNWVTIADMSSADYVKATEKHLTEKGVADKNLELHPVGTVLYSMYATLGKVSELAVAATINQAMLAIQFRKGVDKAFMKYALKAFEPWAVAEATESTQKNLNAEKVRRFPMPFPPLAEQRAIVSYLDGACERIGRAAELVEREIALYRRLKRALVNEVVTGKREVP